MSDCAAPACKRTGMCCRTILLDVSPANMRESYRAWRDNDKRDIVRLRDIFLIYPMLEGRCRGKIKINGVMRYVYGPCKNLTTDEIDGRPIASCSIHADRPALCSGYPNYHNTIELQATASPIRNPGYMKGCGYNEDAGVGLDETAEPELLPLEDSEK